MVEFYLCGYMIQAQHISKRFGARTVLKDLSFEVERGEYVGFIGANGAGKTTLMRILAGYWAPSTGSVRIDGLDLFTHALAARRRMGYLPQDAALYPEMRVDEYLSFRARLRGVPRRRRRDRIEEVKALFGLKEAERRVIGLLSRGFWRRIAIADTWLNNPELLLLDEPMAGLDPEHIRLVRELLGNAARRATLIMAAGGLGDVATLCRRVFVLHRGRIVACDTPARLAVALDGRIGVTVEIKGNPDEVRVCLQQLPGVCEVLLAAGGETESAPEWRRYLLRCAIGTDVRAALFALVVGRKWVLRELTLERNEWDAAIAALTADLDRKVDLG